MLDMVVSLISNLVSLGLKLYSERNDKHEEILKEWKDLQERASALEAKHSEYRRERDAATLKRLDELEHKAGLAASLAIKVP
jgi:uncharacterized membrane protein (DUF106 family)